MNETLIDGGLICNTPSLYAYQMAKNLLDKPNIRLLSLGTGENTEIDKKMSDKENFSKLDSIMSIANQDFVTTFEMIAADKMMREILPDTGRYLRMNVETKAALDDKDIEKMQRDGNQMYMNNQTQIEGMLRTIIDEKYSKWIRTWNYTIFYKY